MPPFAPGTLSEPVAWRGRRGSGFARSRRAQVSQSHSMNGLTSSLSVANVARCLTRSAEARPHTWQEGAAGSGPDREVRVRPGA